MVSATSVVLLDEAGEAAARFEFLNDDPAAFVAALSEQSGTAPTETTETGGFEGAEFTTRYVWDAMTISSAFSTQQCEPQCRGTVIVLTGTTIGDVPLRTASGVTVGSTAERAIALGARATAEIPLAAEPENPELLSSDTESTRIVVLDLDETGSVITSIRASGWFVTFGNI